MGTIGKPKMTWRVPRWAFVPRLWRSLRRYILNPQAISRICAGSLGSCAAIILVLKILFPAMILPNLWHVVAAVPLVLLALVLQFGVLAAIPPSITLRSDRLHKSHGQSGLHIKADQVVAAHIFVHSDDRVRLKIRYRHRSRMRTLVVGIPSTVDLDRLVTMLPVTSQIRDARSRSISFQSCLDR